MLPDNGKVVIIDDKYEDVKVLMQGLSSERVPFLYYQDDLGTDLPESPLTGVRIIFLDLLLIDDNNPSTKKVISSIISRLKRIISTENGPYILIYWSTKIKNYGKALEKELNKPKLKLYKPIITLKLTKPSNLNTVKNELAKRFEDFKSLKAFLLLESLVNNAGTLVVNQFTNIFPVDTDWNKNLKDVLYKTGEARVGENNFKTMSDSEKIKNSLLTISSTIDEKLDEVINLCKFSEIKFEQIKQYDTTKEAKAKVNGSLHLTGSFESTVKSGNLYYIRGSQNIKESILSNKLFNNYVNRNLEPKLFFIDLTPGCDYTQSKNYFRGVYGIIANHDKKFSENRPPAYLLKSPLLFIKNNPKYLVLDFRFIVSAPGSESPKNAAFKINNELLTEFQVELAKHISRPGYTSL